MTAVALVLGPPDHGVVRHGRQLAHHGGLAVVEDAADAPPGSTVVLDVTDRLLGRTVGEAGVAIEELLGVLAARRCRLVSALHDIPTADDWSPARAALYRRLIAASVGVLACSRTEAGRARALGATRVAVVPLPVPPPMPRPAAAPLESVTVAGFVWPGKGHEEVLACLDVLPAGTVLVVAGRAADGHDDVLAALGPVRVTGHTGDEEFAALLQAPTVPVAPNRSGSASASIAAWWSAGRRPLVPDGPYVRELAAEHPRTLGVYDDLRAALLAAWRDPGSTWLEPGAAPGPRAAEVAEMRRLAVAAWT